MSYSYKGILVTNIIQQNGTSTYSPSFGATSPGVALPQALPSQYTIDLVNDNPTYKYANIGTGNISVYAPNGTNTKGSIANTAIYNSTSNNAGTSYTTPIPVGCKNISYWLVGGGGGGGGSGGSSVAGSKTGNGGSGGIGGYYAPTSPFLNSTTGQTTYNIIVGNPGNGGNAGTSGGNGGGSGNNGGSSTFTIGATLLGTANGGSGGGNSSGTKSGNTNSGGNGSPGNPGAPANVGTEYYPQSNYGLQGSGGGGVSGPANGRSGNSGSGGYAQVFYFYN